MQSVCFGIDSVKQFVRVGRQCHAILASMRVDTVKQSVCVGFDSVKQHGVWPNVFLQKRVLHQLLDIFAFVYSILRLLSDILPLLNDLLFTETRITTILR